MKWGIIFLIALVPTIAQAKHHHHHHHHHYKQPYISNCIHTPKPNCDGGASGLVKVNTAAGIITVASDIANNFKGFIDELVSIGYHAGNVHCFAATGHIRHSLHHTGHACDFDQSGWNRAPAIMHTQIVTNLAHKYGLRSGCEFRSRKDCGHIDAGFSHKRYANALNAFARSSPQWADEPINIRQWFQELMQPDNSTVSCCGEADAFEADTFDVEGDHYVAIITDGHGVIPNGTRIPVPNAKMKWDKGNPTGHGILFIGSGGQIYCYVTPGGI